MKHWLLGASLALSFSAWSLPGMSVCARLWESAQIHLVGDGEKFRDLLNFRKAFAPHSKKPNADMTNKAIAELKRLIEAGEHPEKIELLKIQIEQMIVEHAAQQRAWPERQVAGAQVADPYKMEDVMDFLASSTFAEKNRFLLENAELLSPAQANTLMQSIYEGKIVGIKNDPVYLRLARRVHFHRVLNDWLPAEIRYYHGALENNRQKLVLAQKADELTRTPLPENLQSKLDELSNELNSARDYRSMFQILILEDKGGSTARPWEETLNLLKEVAPRMSVEQLSAIAVQAFRVYGTNQTGHRWLLNLTKTMNLYSQEAEKLYEAVKPNLKAIQQVETANAIVPYRKHRHRGAFDPTIQYARDAKEMTREIDSWFHEGAHDRFAHGTWKEMEQLQKRGQEHEWSLKVLHESVADLKAHPQDYAEGKGYFTPLEHSNYNLDDNRILAKLPDVSGYKRQDKRVKLYLERQLGQIDESR